MEDPNMNPRNYKHLIYDKRSKSIQWKKDSIFNKWCWHNWIRTCRKLQIDPYLSPCMKLNCKWIKDLSINPVTLNLLEEIVGTTLEQIGTGDRFRNIRPVEQTLRSAINKRDLLKLRSFYNAKETVSKTKRPPTEWENIFNNPTSDRGLISKIYSELKRLATKTPNNEIKK